MTLGLTALLIAACGGTDGKKDDPRPDAPGAVDGQDPRRLADANAGPAPSGQADGGSAPTPIDGPAPDAARDGGPTPDAVPDAGADARPLPVMQLAAPWAGTVIAAPPADGGTPDAGSPTTVRGAAGFEAATGTIGLEVNGTGIDRKRVSDDVFFLNQRVKGDAEIVARVTGFEGCTMGSNAKAGVMLRESLGDDAPYVAAVVDATAALTAADGRIIQGADVFSLARRSQGAQSERLFVNNDPRLPVFVRLIRRGRNVTIAYTTDGTRTAWLPAGELAFPALADMAHLGLFVSSSESGGKSETCRAFFDQVHVRTGLLPEPWETFDLANEPAAQAPGAAVAKVQAGAVSEITLTGSGQGIGDRSNGIDPGLFYAFRPVSGSVEMVARLVEMRPAAGNSAAGDGAIPGSLAPGAKAGIMLRSTLAVRSINLFVWQRPQQSEMVVDPANQQAAIGTSNRRADNDGTKPIWISNEAVQPPVWLRLVRDYRDLDRIYTFYSKTNVTGANPTAPTAESDWTLLGLVTGRNDGDNGRKEMIGVGFIGFAVASGSNTAAVSATFDRISYNTSPSIPPGGWTLPTPPDAGAPDAAPGN